MAFGLRFNLSTTGSLELLLVVLVALRWGFWQATVASVVAVICLNVLFTPPIFAFVVADSKNWISLATFEATAVVVSRLSSKVRENAAQAERQRSRTATLYELSKAILLIDGHQSTPRQLEGLIGEMLRVERVELWLPSDANRSRETALAAYREGVNADAERISRRVLRLGTTAIGALVMDGWEVDTLLADAVASLAAIALERARAVEKENRAEAARNTEQLRSAVLDGLAHGFKTPLTAIQAASSGLLAIGGLSAVQADLVGLIDERAEMLATLTTRLLKAAALEGREVRLQRARVSILELVREVVQDLGDSRIRVAGDEVFAEVDGALVKLAMLQLIDNAVKYSTEGDIIASVRRDELETVVTVANVGEPIPITERERIFERFYRGADARRGPTGTGLGLSIVKKIAEVHGGRVGVECLDGETTVLFTLAHRRQA